MKYHMLSGWGAEGRMARGLDVWLFKIVGRHCYADKVFKGAHSTFFYENA